MCIAPLRLRLDWYVWPPRGSYRDGARAHLPGLLEVFKEWANLGRHDFVMISIHCCLTGANKVEGASGVGAPTLWAPTLAPIGAPTLDIPTPDATAHAAPIHPGLHWPWKPPRCF